MGVREISAVGLPVDFRPLLPLHPVRHHLKEAMRDGSRGRFLGVRSFLVGFALLAILLLGLSWLLLDDTLAGVTDSWIGGDPVDPLTYSLLVAGLLSSDLFLPIPSSGLITHAGRTLGVMGGTLVGSVGLTFGGLVGFYSARILGNRFVERRVEAGEREKMQEAIRKTGAWVIVLLRPVPILAEASVLLLAAGGMSFRLFLGWLLVSNLCVAGFFAAFGHLAAEQGMGEATSLLVSLVIPVLLLLLSKYQFGNSHRKEKTDDVPT